MGGPQAVAAIRPLGCSGLIVGLTGNSLEEDTAHFLAQGADAVSSKPLNYPKWVQLIQSKYL